MSNLQLFTEPGGDGGGSGEGDGAGTGGDPGSNSNTTMSFDDFLKLEGNQSEFDRRVQKAIDTAVTNAQTKWKTLTDDKVSEAEKLAQIAQIHLNIPWKSTKLRQLQMTGQHLLLIIKERIKHIQRSKQ